MNNTEIPSGNHIIVCGTTSSAAHIIEELIKYKAIHKNDSLGSAFSSDFVVINNSTENISKIFDTKDVCYIEGDATDDDILEKANIKNAFGIFPVLESEKDNLYITITARQKNPSIRIIASTANPQIMRQKLYQAGADSVISPDFIGGLRLASETARPIATEFLDEMLRNKYADIHISEIKIKDDSDVCGTKLELLQIPQKVDILIIAIMKSNHESYIYNPPASTIIESGDTIVIFGKKQKIEEFKLFVDN